MLNNFSFFVWSRQDILKTAQKESKLNSFIGADCSYVYDGFIASAYAYTVFDSIYPCWFGIVWSLLITNLDRL
jgi:hypothetical protein